MIDQDKVIKGLEEVDAYFHRMTEVCYRGDEATFCDLKEKVVNALALLKEQEELNDHYQSLVVAYNDMRKGQEPVEPYLFDEVWKCGKCGNGWVAFEGSKAARCDYCPKCGQAVKWE